MLGLLIVAMVSAPLIWGWLKADRAMNARDAMIAAAEREAADRFWLAHRH